MAVEGRCHCGAVRFVARYAPTDINDCQCGHSQKRGVLCGLFGKNSPKWRVVKLSLISGLSFLLPFAAAAQSSVDKEAIETAWDAEEYYSETKVLDVIESPGAEAMIPLTLVIVKNSGWTLDEVEGKASRTANIYSDQCGITLSPIVILESKNSNGAVADVDHPYGHVVYISTLLKPVVYFLERETENRQSGGSSWPEAGPGGTEYDLINSIFLFRSFAIEAKRSADLQIPGVEGEYEVLAHEVGHVLINVVEHSDVPGDIMSDGDVRTNVVTASQCRQIRKNWLKSK